MLDIKPYVPYADALPGARSGFATPPAAPALPVTFSEQAQADLERADPRGERQLRALIEQVLAQDPRPGYMDRYPQRREFGIRLFEQNIRWRIDPDGITVIAIEPAGTN